MESDENLISRTNAILVIRTIGDNPGIGQRSVIEGDGRNSKLKRLIELVEAGMVEEITTSNGRLYKNYRLTEKGERFLRMWKAFENGKDVAPTNCGTPPEDRTEVKSEQTAKPQC